jgi:sarcosine oxidase
MRPKIYDVVVVGAGVFGAWTALHLARRRKSVMLVDAHEPGHLHSSSGDESRIIRMAYGADEIYTRSAQRSLVQWKELFLVAHREELFQKTGVLWLGDAGSAQMASSVQILRRCGVPFEELDRGELLARYPQMNLDGITSGIYEPQSGVLMARRAVGVVVAEAIRHRAEFKLAEIAQPEGVDGIDFIETRSGERFVAKQFVFATGAWLAKLFPEYLGGKVFPTRQPVFYIGVPDSDERFSAPELQTWLIKNDECYGMPALGGRGLKIALDRHGEAIDPDTQSRVVTQEEVEAIRRLLAYRFPALASAPIVETRVCQYENTSSGDFLIDRHPTLSNVWFAGGGSGHGFKHGPVVGEYVAAQILEGAKPEPRFLLKKKETVQRRAVY